MASMYDKALQEYFRRHGRNIPKEYITRGFVDRLAAETADKEAEEKEYDITTNLVKTPANAKDPLNGFTDINSNNEWLGLRHSNNLYSNAEIDLYNNTYRYGIAIKDVVSTGREFLFFTKPDLHICQMDPDTGSCENYLNSDLKPRSNNEDDSGNVFWMDLFSHRKNTIKCLQDSYENGSDRFNHLLQNTCISNLDVPQIQSEMIETPTNIYGVGFSYRGSSEDSDDGPEFSLEFKDTKWLDVYMFFKAYEEYETLKHHGAVAPWEGYTIRKIVHDSFSIYKFIVDEDMETILYYGKMYGVTPTSLPRDVFSSPTFDNGITYSINFKAAFYEDMKAEILSDFNALAEPHYSKQNYTINVYNTSIGRADMRPGRSAMVTVESTNRSPTGYVYKLKWKGGQAQ